MLDFSLNRAGRDNALLAEFMWTGTIFVSHSCTDDSWCRDNIIQPIDQQFGRDYRFYSNSNERQNNGNDDVYFQLIAGALNFAKTVLVISSRNSHGSNWVRFETRAAVQQRHPIILCRIDNTDPADLRDEFADAQRSSFRHLPILLIDFQQDAAIGTQQLLGLLELPEFKPQPLWNDKVWAARAGPWMKEQYNEWRAKKSNQASP